MQAQGDGSSSSADSVDDSSGSRLQPFPIPVGVGQHPRDLLGLVAKQGRNSDAGESQKNRRARKTILDATTTVFKLHGALPVLEVKVNITSRRDEKRTYMRSSRHPHQHPIITPGGSK